MNVLAIAQLHQHIELKTDGYLLYNIYEVLLRAMYRQKHFRVFPTIRYLCDGIVIMASLTHLENQDIIPITHLRPDALHYLYPPK